MNKLLERLDELEKAATPGPWGYLYLRSDTDEDKREADIGPIERKGAFDEVIRRDSGVYGPDGPTADLIIEMRNALPKLLCVIKAARKLLESQRSTRFSLTAVTVTARAAAELEEAIQALDKEEL